ncbi:MAG: hypothetical protein JNM83_18475 [Myxococcales bacterium]|nr:hypothetical protein [Myxococcales bacterium]
MADTDELKRLAADYVGELRDKNLAQTTQDKQAAITRYWEERGPMFRSLAQLVIAALDDGKEGEDAIRWALDQFRQKVIAAAQTDSQRGAFASWLVQRKEFLRRITVQLWTSAARAVPPPYGIYVALEAHPNPDFAPSTRQGSVSIPLVWKSIENLSQAVDVVDDFIVKNQLGSGNFVRFAGRVAKDKKPWAQISYNRRVWEGWHWNPSQELDRNGYRIPSVEVAATGTTQIPEAVNSYKAEMEVGNAWSSNQRRYATAKEADEAGKDLYRRWTSAEDYRVVPSSDPPNVEPVINQPEEDSERSEAQILFFHVGDKPKPAETAQTPRVAETDGLSRTKPEGYRGHQPPGEQIYRYTVLAIGLWGRARKESRVERIVLAQRVDPKQPWPLDRLVVMGRNKVAELKPKPGLKWRIEQEIWYVQPDGTEQTVLNEGTVLHTEIVK